MVKIKIVLCLIVTAFLCSTTKGMSADFENRVETERQNIIASLSSPLSAKEICSVEPTWRDQFFSNLKAYFFKPKLPNSYFSIGGIGTNDENAQVCVTVVKVNPYLKKDIDKYLAPPRDWKMVWANREEKAGSLWKGIPPSVDFTCVGDVAKTGYKKPNLPRYRCVHNKFLKKFTASKLVWSDEGAELEEDEQVTVLKLATSGSFVVVKGREDSHEWYDIKGVLSAQPDPEVVEALLEKRIPKIKEEVRLEREKQHKEETRSAKVGVEPKEAEKSVDLANLISSLEKAEKEAEKRTVKTKQKVEVEPTAQITQQIVREKPVEKEQVAPKERTVLEKPVEKEQIVPKKPVGKKRTVLEKKEEADESFFQNISLSKITSYIGLSANDVFLFTIYGALISVIALFVGVLTNRVVVFNDGLDLTCTFGIFLVPVVGLLVLNLHAPHGHSDTNPFQSETFSVVQWGIVVVFGLASVACLVVNFFTCIKYNGVVLGVIVGILKLISCWAIGLLVIVWLFTLILEQMGLAEERKKNFVGETGGFGFVVTIFLTLIGARLAIWLVKKMINGKAVEDRRAMLAQGN